MVLRGSSPHTRDKYRSGITIKTICRIIPAYAGQMDFSPRFVYVSEDHPRIRGTNSYHLLLALSLLGSSPHTRDKSQLRYVAIMKQGIIPAYARQITFLGNFMPPTEDHPRIRGTNSMVTVLPSRLMGSSPHTRDKYLKIP